jgi:CDP-diacylglycerol--serine O-phosphatidyltransferase
MNIADLKPRNNNGPDNRAPFVGFHRMIPNLMTLTAMAAGLTSIQYALNEKWEFAVLAILIAAILDAMDGATARILKAQSEFGAQLDSLSDFLAFGVAPAIILHMWILEEAGKIGWMAMIIYAAATALRLARFNVTQEDLPAWKKGFFSGIPSPAGAGLALFPLVIWIQSPHFFEQFAFASPLVGLWTILIAALMVSRIPTFSSKKIKIPAKLGMPALAFAALVIAALVHAPWQTLTIASLAYMASIPFGISSFRKLQKEHQDDEQMTDLAIGAIAIDDYNTTSEKED